MNKQVITSVYSTIPSPLRTYHWTEWTRLISKPPINHLAPLLTVHIPSSLEESSALFELVHFPTLKETVDPYLLFDIVLIGI